MPVKGWKAIESQEPDWDISDDDLENLFDNEIFKIEESERPTMKNVFVDSKKIKKQKISFEIAKEIKGVKGKRPGRKLTENGRNFLET